jgi:hypothetical protein
MVLLTLSRRRFKDRGIFVPRKKLAKALRNKKKKNNSLKKVYKPKQESTMFFTLEIFHDRVKIDKQYLFRPDSISPSQWIRLWEACAKAIKAVANDRS